jgi:hypothetical protein
MNKPLSDINRSLSSSIDSLLWASAYAMYEGYMYEGHNILGVSPGDLADVLQSLANLLEIDGPYARLSRIAREDREREHRRKEAI